MLVLATAKAALAGEHGPSAITLPATGLTIELPDGWMARETAYRAPGAPTGAPESDLITRMRPMRPVLFFTLVSFGGRTCDEWTSVVGGSRPDWSPVVRPAFLPTGWHPTAFTNPTQDRPGNVSVNFCLDTLTGVLLGSMEYQGAVTSPDLRAVTPVLVRIAQAAGVDSEPAAIVAAPPIEEQTPSSAPAAAPPAAAPSPRPPPPPPPPGARPSRTYSPSRESAGPDPDALRFELSLAVVQPDDKPDAYSAVVGLDSVGVDGDGPVGFATSYGIALGVTSDLNIPFDGRFAAGFGLRLGRHFRLVPLVGVGLDTMGSGDEASFKVPLAFYWYVEGRLRVAFSSFAVEAIGGRHGRGSITGDADEVPYENRFTALISKQIDSLAVSLGGRLVDYGQAKAVGGVVGLSF